MRDKLFKKNLRFVQKRRRAKTFSSNELELIEHINQETERFNMDNISRTKAYLQYYNRNKEIPWSFLASMVSRNAGWNMTDLEGNWLSKALNDDYRNLLFMTFERANWLIFSDAYPQLLLYEWSKKLGKSLMGLASAFSVSVFIETEWEVFLDLKAEKRLMMSQIINEQNVIQKPVIENAFYKKNVFTSGIYRLQDWLHFSSVIFPTKKGELYGFSVHDFSELSRRIDLGAKLAELLFHPNYFAHFYKFSADNEHTGSRYDYEKFLKPPRARSTPYLRLIYPVITHAKEPLTDWFTGRNTKKRWYKPVALPKLDQYLITEWYEKKQKQLHIGIAIEQLLK
ncbi:DUF2515 family protein [Litchfieldia alkalitelluris]|uniref:DUF2515 family protein n=1 Tax=Litchfieldia alkalitelluris TaxID=304268 RepID=UPI001F2C2DE2|nr:DUF2515 family protein [Litchfieldia alkalitelluris]